MRAIGFGGGGLGDHDDIQSVKQNTMMAKRLTHMAFNTVTYYRPGCGAARYGKAKTTAAAVSRGNKHAEEWVARFPPALHDCRKFRGL